MRTVLLWLACLQSLAFSADPGIVVGTQFRVPVLNSAGKTVQARATVAADKTLRLLFVDGDDVGDLAYKLDKLGQVDLQPLPIPSPTPQPTPTPTPTPAPLSDNITTGPLHVLFLYESEELGKMTPEQASILSSKLIRDYLVQSCEKDGETPCFRFLDKDVPTDKLAADWQQVIARGKPNKMPWVIIANGKHTYEGAWPKTVAETLALLKKYGG